MAPIAGAPAPSFADSLRSRHNLRDPLSGLLHLGGLLASLVGTAFLLFACRNDALRLLTGAVFGLTMCGCFFSSVRHHLVRGTRETEMRLLRVDHAAIYPFIAGSYTPVCVQVLPAPGGLLLLGAVWAIALAGLVYKLFLAEDPVNVEEPPGLVDTILYVAMGWLLAFQLPEFVAHSAAGTVWLAALGGIAYTAGAVILTRQWLDFWPGRFGHHEIWHFCVLLGAVAHYAYILRNLT